MNEFQAKMVELRICQDKIETLRHIYNNLCEDFDNKIQEEKFEDANLLLKDIKSMHYRMMKLRIEEGNLVAKL